MSILSHPEFLIVIFMAVLVAAVAGVSAPARRIVSRIFAQPGFLAAAAVLFVAAISLNATTTFMRVHFKKLPIDPGQELRAIPAQFGPWHMVSNDEPLPKDVEETLGTEMYVFRDYVDERIVGMSVIEQFRDKSTAERRAMVASIQHNYPEAVVSLAVTYYTGMVDTVAHIPDRCYIADGYQPSRYEQPTWLLAHDDGARQLQVRFINFEDQTGWSKITRSVAYFFHVNGRYESDPLGVRRSLQNLFERYGYYAKVELMTLLPDPEESARIMTDFLSVALPDIEKTWPDWNRITGRDVK